MICLTFDVEERFHSHLTPGDAPREWSSADRIARIVDLLVEGQHHATLFVVGELALRYPALIRRIADAGLEVASHSHTHLRLDRGDRAACMRDIARSKAVLEDLIGREVIGFRAPTWTASRGDDWLWDHLLELGFRYDSSLFPFRTHLYGSNSNPLRPFEVRGGLLEIPPSVTRFGPVRVPYGGGFYFRLYPDRLTRGLIARDLRAGKTPVVYFHPWEFDPRAQVMETEPLARFIANYRSAQTWPRFVDLLGRYQTKAMCQMLPDSCGALLAGAASSPRPVAHGM